MSASAPPAFPDTTLVVLTGGQGRRLGRGEKALVRVGGRPLVAWVLDHAPRFAATWLVGPPSLGLARLGWPIVPDVVPGAGAPGGVLTGLIHSGTPWVCALACDMPLVSEAALAALADQRPGADAVVPEVAGRLQPLHAFYRVEAARPVAWEVARAGGSLQELLARLDARRVPLADPDTVADVDTAEALAAVEARLARRR